MFLTLAFGRIKLTSDPPLWNSPYKQWNELQRVQYVHPIHIPPVIVQHSLAI